MPLSSEFQAFETLTPKSIVHRYTSLLLEQVSTLQNFPSLSLMLRKNKLERLLLSFGSIAFTAKANVCG
jgi:hypothetical protein